MRFKGGAAVLLDDLERSRVDPVAPLRRIDRAGRIVWVLLNDPVMWKEQLIFFYQIQTIDLFINIRGNGSVGRVPNTQCTQATHSQLL